MSTYTTTPPTAVHTAFNPIIYKITTDNPSEVSATIKVTHGLNIYELKKEFFNQVATFDLSSIIKRLFANTGGFLIGTDAFIDNRLFINYSVEVTDGVHIWVTYHSAINAVIQQGFTSSLVTRQGNFLTGFDTLKFYSGYPFSVSVLAFAGSNYYKKGDGSEIYVNVNKGVYNIDFATFISQVSIMDETAGVNYLTDINGYFVIDDNGNPIIAEGGSGTTDLKVKNITNECIPQHPFYVRWINAIGGWEYFMFGQRQFINTESEEVVTTNLYSEDNTSNEVLKILNIEGKGSITAGADGISVNEFETLKGLIFSPTIQYYNVDAVNFLPCYIDTMGISQDNSIYTNNIEFTFVTDKIKTQF